MKTEFSAGGIVFRKTNQQIQYALILNSYDAWTFPKGHIEKPEKAEETALREVQEEIGLSNLKIVQLIDRIDYFFKMNDVTYHKYVDFYLMTAGDDTKLTHQPSEVQNAQWFTYAEARKKLFYKEDLPLLRAAQKYIFDCNADIFAVK